jgi:hypothetical protein
MRLSNWRISPYSYRVRIEYSASRKYSASLAADERLAAARNTLDEAKRLHVETPERQATVRLMEQALLASRTCRDLPANAIRSAAAEVEPDD